MSFLTFRIASSINILLAFLDSPSRSFPSCADLRADEIDVFSYSLYRFLDHHSYFC